MDINSKIYEILKEIKNIDSYLDILKEQQMRNDKNDCMDKEIGKEIFTLKHEVDNLLKKYDALIKDISNKT